MNLPDSLRELATDAVVERLGWVLVHSLWQFALVALAAAIIVRLLGRNRAAVRYAVLVGALGTIVVSPAVTWSLLPTPVVLTRSPLEHRVPPVDEAVTDIASDEPAAAVVTDLPTEPVPALPASEPVTAAGLQVPASEPAPLSWGERAERAVRPWLVWIVVGWSLGVVLCSVRPLLGWHALWRLRRVGVSPVGEEIAAALRRVAGQLGLRRAVQVLQSTLVQTPVLIGYFRPAILLPVGLATGLPIAQLEAILAHELAHVRRHDFVVNLLQTLVETLCFYHPAVWWLSRQIRVEREHCCDDLVVGLLGNRVEYGRALLAVEELRGAGSVLALGMADGVLLSRVRRLFGGGSERVVDRWPAALLSLAAVGLALVLGLVWHRASQDEGKEPPAAAIAKLPGDIAVELVGVSFHPSKDKPWWKADGRPLEPRPTLEGGFSVMSGSPEQAQCREFLIHIRGLPQDNSVTTDYGGVSAATGSTWADGLWVGEHGAGPFKTPTARVRVGLTTEPYGPAVIFHRSGQLAEGTKIPEELLPFYGRAVPLRVEENEGRTELVVESAPYNELHKLAAWQLSAVDVDGERVRSSSEWAPAEGGRHIGFKLPLKRLDYFEFRLRPYRHWATFENVSLEPGRTTEVKVSTESLPASKPERYSATLPDGVKVSFVGITKNTAPANEAWRPDGLPLGDVPEWPAGMVLYSRGPGNTVDGRTKPPDVEVDANARDFLFEFQGLKTLPSFSFAMPTSGAGYSHDPVTDPYRLRISGRLRDESKFPGATFDPPADEVRVGVTTEAWGKWLQISPTGEVLNPPTPGDLYPANYARVQLQRVGPSEKDAERLSLILRQPERYDRLYAFEIRGIDTEGGEHWVTNWISQGSVDDSPVETEWGLAQPLPPGKQLARFEYRLRPYRHWVTFKGVSLEPGKESDVKVSVETVPATADFPRPRPADVRGLDLSRAAVRHYSEATRLSPEQQTPELLVPGSDPAEPWRRPKNVFLMPLAENIWLKYPAGSGHFYINHRPDGTWQHERMYGPIEGEPFELLKLEELFREQLKPGATGGDPRYRLTLMFRTGDPELIRRAWNLAEPEIAAPGVEGRYTGQDHRRHERLEMLQRVREALRDEAEAFGRAELTELTAQIRHTVAAAEIAIDAVNDAVSDDQYEPVTDLQSGIEGKIPDALWGQPVDGLRLGLVPRESIDWAEWQKLPADEEFPAAITATAGDELLYQLLVENVSDREIKLCGYVVGEEMGRGLDVLDRSGRPVFVNGLHTSIPHFLSYWRLKPGERRLLPLPAVHLSQQSSDSERSGLGYFVEAAPGEYTLRCRFRFGHLDNERHRYVPGKSEWIGELSTGAQKITVAERVLDAGETPAADQSVSLADAVRDFNAENVQRGRGQDQPPLTEEEVLKAIQTSDWKRDAKDVSEREFAAFKAVAKTRRLPAGAQLEVLTGVQSDAFTTSRLWSIRLIMPALERAGTVGFSIRHTVLGEEKIDPQQVAWGRPDADGLSLGLFLSPRKAQYQIGDRVQLRLFVRNEGRKAIDDLTFWNITWPVIEDFTVTDQTGARVAVRNGHEEWSGPQWIAGATSGRLAPGEVHALRVPFEVGIGGDVDKLVGRILDAKPRQTLRLRVRAANGSERIRAADEPKPESGEVSFAVAAPATIKAPADAAQFYEKLKEILPPGWKVYRQGLAFEFRGPRGLTEGTQDDEARITFWFSERFADSTVKDGRDPKLPRIGSWGITRLGETLFTRNMAAIENWPGFLDDVYWMLPVEHVALVGRIDVDQEIDGPHSLGTVMSNAGTRIDVRIDESGKRVDHIALDPFRKKVEEYGLARETQFVVVGELPDPDTAKSKTERQHVVRQQEQLARMKEGAAKYGAKVITLQEYIAHLLQLRRNGLANPLPEVKDGNSIEVPVVAVPPEKPQPPANPARNGQAALLDAMIKAPSLAILRRLLSGAETKQPEPVELLDEGRFGEEVKERDEKVKLLDAADGRYAVIFARVRPATGDEGGIFETDLSRLPECAFLFDLEGHLIATIGGQTGMLKSGQAGSPDRIDVQSIGPKEDWFVRVMRWESNGEFDYRTDYYRIASPVVRSLRYLHYANSNGWSNGPEKVTRWGTLYFNFPRVSDKLSPNATGVTRDNVAVNPTLIWDGEMNRFVGVETQRANGKPLYQVDRRWSQEFDPMTPKADQLVIAGGPHPAPWSYWQTVVPEKFEAIVTVTIPQREGPARVSTTILQPGAKYLGIQERRDDATGTDALIISDGSESKGTVVRTLRLGDRPAQTLPVVQLLNPGESARLLTLPLKDSSEPLTVDIRLRPNGQQPADATANAAAAGQTSRNAASDRGTLTGRFVYDGEAPPRKDVWPQFAEIDATQRQQPGSDGRFSGVEATYREFLKQNIRPNTLDPSLLVDKAGGVANVVVWVTSKEIPWTPPADLAQRPVTIRLQDGNFAPRMTVATVGQPVLVENHDPVPFHFHAEFLRALNSPVNVLLPARSIAAPQRLTLPAAEPFPARFQSDIGPWANGWLMIHTNPNVAVSQADGSFALPDLPPGEWEFRVWHERAGYVRHWPQGRFKQAIQPGENNLGTIRLKPEIFGVPAAAAGPPPSNREQIGEVGGKPVFRDEVTAETLHSIFLAPVLERYRETHRAEIAPTDAELRSAGEYFDRKHRERLEAAGGEAKLREQMRTIETQLARPGQNAEEEQKLELEHLRLRSQLRPPSDDGFARFLLNNWKLQKHLYENYEGGRILWQQAGLEAFDAMHRWMEAQEQAGVFKITDAALRARFYEYWTRDHGPFLTADKERIRREFLEPEWLVPAPAKE